MPENPGIPPLFRDIFKNAYLPYRAPETLRAFLKIIDEFEYDHSERLGDAGQFRTPRHIIDFMVAIIDRLDRPGYGYDLLSYTAPGKERYIEVKSVGTLPGAKGCRFFLSDNEHSVSNSNVHCDAYFFYLVFFNGEGEPTELWPIAASELYKRAEIKPASYIVGFQFSR